MSSARELARAARRGPVLVHGATLPYVAYLAARLAGTRDPAEADLRPDLRPPIIVVAPDDGVAARSPSCTLTGWADARARGRSARWWRSGSA